MARMAKPIQPDDPSSRAGRVGEIRGDPALLADNVVVTRVDAAIGWARKYSIFPYPFATACCAMEFMSLTMTPYDIDMLSADQSASPAREPAVVAFVVANGDDGQCHRASGLECLAVPNIVPHGDFFELNNTGLPRHCWLELGREALFPDCQARFPGRPYPIRPDAKANHREVSLGVEEDSGRCRGVNFGWADSDLSELGKRLLKSLHLQHSE